MSEIASHEVWTGARLATMAGDAPYGLIDDGAMVVRGAEIVWTGPRTSLPPIYSAARVRDVEDRCITPGFVDCHTHVVYAGDRAREFELRLQGADYAEIARSGGGILSTVRATRAASEAQLAAAADELAGLLAAKSSLTLTATKLAVNAAAAQLVSTAGAWSDADALLSALSDPESREAAAAYLGRLRD